MVKGTYQEPHQEFARSRVRKQPVNADALISHGQEGGYDLRVQPQTQEYKPALKLYKSLDCRKQPYMVIRGHTPLDLRLQQLFLHDNLHKSQNVNTRETA